MLLGIFTFLLSYPICWGVIAHNISQVFFVVVVVFLWYQLQCLLFDFWFYLHLLVFLSLCNGLSILSFHFYTKLIMVYYHLYFIIVFCVCLYITYLGKFYTLIWCCVAVQCPMVSTLRNRLRMSCGDEFPQLLFIWAIFVLYFEDCFAENSDLGGQLLPFCTLNIWSHFFLAFKVSAEKSVHSLTVVLLYVTCRSCLTALQILYLPLPFTIFFLWLYWNMIDN